MPLRREGERPPPARTFLTLWKDADSDIPIYVDQLLAVNEGLYTRWTDAVP